ncbi:hypothetical protein QBC40DRAFT_265855 [Triangularia verruculosa]|uniref:Uncharacterized protein n=1 Tax=Triangularia verruculosa TaxID=2587418 RepID=A0AAN6XF81_9PEZI|nr:hypothetical protein QBC40DRAFT_265855 [Triangularia verruculosa]
MVHLLDLPDKLLIKICEGLLSTNEQPHHATDIKNCRLTCRRLCTASSHLWVIVDGRSASLERFNEDQARHTHKDGSLPPLVVPEDLDLPCPKCREPQGALDRARLDRVRAEAQLGCLEDKEREVVKCNGAQSLGPAVQQVIDRLCRAFELEMVDLRSRQVRFAETESAQGAAPTSTPANQTTDGINRHNSILAGGQGERRPRSPTIASKSHPDTQAQIDEFLGKNPDIIQAIIENPCVFRPILKTWLALQPTEKSEKYKRALFELFQDQQLVDDFIVRLVAKRETPQGVDPIAAQEAALQTIQQHQVFNPAISPPQPVVNTQPQPPNPFPNQATRNPQPQTPFTMNPPLQASPLLRPPQPVMSTLPPQPVMSTLPPQPVMSTLASSPPVPFTIHRQTHMSYLRHRAQTSFPLSAALTNLSFNPNPNPNPNPLAPNQHITLLYFTYHYLSDSLERSNASTHMLHGMFVPFAHRSTAEARIDVVYNRFTSLIKPHADWIELAMVRAEKIGCRFEFDDEDRARAREAWAIAEMWEQAVGEVEGVISAGIWEGLKPEGEVLMREWGKLQEGLYGFGRWLEGVVSGRFVVPFYIPYS